ncbi:sel1 repeat family protein, partial [Pseudomonas sp. HMWF031]
MNRTGRALSLGCLLLLQPLLAMGTTQSRDLLLRHR